MKPFKYVKFNKKGERTLRKAHKDISKLVKSSGSLFEEGSSHGGSKKAGGQKIDRKSLRKLKRKEKKSNRLQYSHLRSSAPPQEIKVARKSPGKIGKLGKTAGNIAKTNNKPQKKVSFEVDDDNEDEDDFSGDDSVSSDGEEMPKARKTPEAPQMKSKHDQLVEDTLTDEREIKRLSKKLRLKPGKIPKSFYGDGDLGSLLELCEMRFDNEIVPEVQDGDESLNATEDKSFTVNDVDCDKEIDSEEIDSDMGDSDYEENTAKRSEDNKEPEPQILTSKNSENEKLKDGNKNYKLESSIGKASENTRNRSWKGKSETGANLDDNDEDYIDQNSDEEAKQKTPKFDPYAGASKYYVPPQKRAKLSCEKEVSNKSQNLPRKLMLEDLVLSEDFDRIYRQCVGLLNRVSETNLGAISKQMQLVYTKYSTSETNVAVTKAAINLCCLTYSVADRLIFEKMALVAVVHKNAPDDLGAQFVHSVTWKMWNNGFKHEDESMRALGSDLLSDKTVLNCVKCVCFLYNFGVVSHKLIFDVIRKFLRCFTMANIESLIAIILTSGFTIRKKSPTDLKDIVMAILQTGQEKLQRFEENDRPRVQYFLDLVTDLKNNNRRKIETSVDFESFRHIQDVVKNLSKDDGSSILVSISLQDILDAGEFGRWWNLGINGAATGSLEKDPGQRSRSNEMSGGSEIIQLAHKSGMNTPFRESLFCAIMTSCDYVEAVDKIIRLKGIKKHIREVPHVIIKCALLERTFNPFYFHVLKGFASYESNNQISVKYAISDRLKDMNVMTGDSELSVFAQLFTCLLEDQVVPLALIRLVSPTNLSDLAQKFCGKFLLVFLSLPKKKLRKWCVDLLQNEKTSEIYHHLNLLVKQNEDFLKTKSKVLGEEKQKVLLGNIQIMCSSDI